MGTGYVCKQEVRHGRGTGVYQRRTYLPFSQYYLQQLNSLNLYENAFTACITTECCRVQNHKNSLIYSFIIDLHNNIWCCYLGTLILHLPNVFKEVQCGTKKGQCEDAEYECTDGSIFKMYAIRRSVSEPYVGFSGIRGSNETRRA